MKFVGKYIDCNERSWEAELFHGNQWIRTSYRVAARLRCGKKHK